MKLVLLLLAPILLFSSCNEDKQYKEYVENKKAALRFQKVGEFSFDGKETADIYVDTKTNIQYMYVWDGMANGGPIFTRLWEK